MTHTRPTPGPIATAVMHNQRHYDADTTAGDIAYALARQAGQSITEACDAEAQALDEAKAPVARMPGGGVLANAETVAIGRSLQRSPETRAAINEALPECPSQQDRAHAARAIWEGWHSPDFACGGLPDDFIDLLGCAIERVDWGLVADWCEWQSQGAR